MNRLFFVVLGMTAVTYLPRMAPMVLLKDIKLPNFLKTFLEFIPYAALGALIIPGVFSSTGDIKSSIIGTIVSVTLAFFKLNTMFVVLGGILGVFLTQTLF
ncbi:MAG: branched-chain amino acid transport [Clostridiales bacterium]|nr:branched-chain amino acid transport [Clostridiales bacterium]